MKVTVIPFRHKLILKKIAVAKHLVSLQNLQVDYDVHAMSAEMVIEAIHSFCAVQSSKGSKGSMNIGS